MVLGGRSFSLPAAGRLRHLELRKNRAFAVCAPAVFWRKPLRTLFLRLNFIYEISARSGPLDSKCLKRRICCRRRGSRVEADYARGIGVETSPASPAPADGVRIDGISNGRSCRSVLNVC